MDWSKQGGYGKPYGGARGFRYSRPKTAPIFYRVSANLLTHENVISVIGEDCSDEVEFFVLEIGASFIWVLALIVLTGK